MGFNIVADENIVLVREIFSSLGDIHLVDGYSLNQADFRQEVGGAEILLVRSVTKINAALLSDLTSLRFVGSATTGTDHVDRGLLSQANIRFGHAPGSNAESVVEYVLAAATSQLAPDVDWTELCVGIIGYGTIGSKVARRFRKLGCSVIACDPPLEKSGMEGGDVVAFQSLDHVLETSDIISIHVPLVQGGEHPTTNLIGREEADLVRAGAIVINTSRGQVVTPEALATMSDTGVGLVLDVWPDEPTPEPELVRSTAIATPHIAGYSYDGKVLGSLMIRDALIDSLGLSDDQRIDPDDDRPRVLQVPHVNRNNWHQVVREMYDIVAESERFKSAYLNTDSPRDEFISQRKNYPRRRSFSIYRIRRSDVDADALPVMEDVLGVGVMP